MSEIVSFPDIDIFLYSLPGICYLSNAHPFEPSIIIESNDPRPLTLLAPGTIFDPTAAFARARVEIIDFASGAVIQKHPTGSTGDTVVQPNYQHEEPFSFLTLEGSGSRYAIYFSTAPRTGHMGRTYFSFDSAGLQSGHKYTLRFSDSGVSWWRYCRKDDLSLPQNGIPMSLDPLGNAALDLHIRRAGKFRVADHLPEPPKVSVSLSATSDICQIRGDPPFTIRLAFTSHAAKPLTVLTARSPLGPQTIVQVADVHTRDWVAIDFYHCLGGREEGRYEPDDFAVLEPEQPHVQEITLDTCDLEKLHNGKEYLICLSDEVARGSFSWWSYDSIEEVVKYAGSVEDSGLFYVPPIPLDLTPEIRFRALDGL
ncbi:MAG: hypothetical protein M1836_007350 [Candelina mexicana]|nr:MAG: hypothetical protein M1836_007350 [Candelina mexicana]